MSTIVGTIPASQPANPTPAVTPDTPVTFTRPNSMGQQVAKKPLPPADVIDSKPIKAALAAYDKAVATELTARRDYARLEQTGRQQAEIADAEAAADALAAGKADPGRRHVQHYEDTLDVARHHRDTATLLVGRALDALNAAGNAHGDEWRASLTRRQDETLKRYTAALNELEQVAHEYAGRAALLRFANGTGAYNPTHAPDTAKIETPTGDEDIRTAISDLHSLGQPAIRKAAERAHPERDKDPWGWNEYGQSEREQTGQAATPHAA